MAISVSVCERETLLENMRNLEATEAFMLMAENPNQFDIFVDIYSKFFQCSLGFPAYLQ